jgi:1-acyl-sn-glycerol-3-phosphate acyltransferase
MYYFIRFFVRLALRIFCSRIRVNDKSFLHVKGPLILASSHPNAFFDAIILASCMKEPVHFLAIGEIADQFLFKKLVEILKIIPVYRLLDHNENLERNDKSLTHCVDVLSDNGIVLIFSEGNSENNWRLRPLKKTTARIALAAMDHTPLISGLSILPIGFNYNSFDGPGKTVWIQSGEPISNSDLPAGKNEADKIHAFNVLLAERISAVVLQTAGQQDKIQMMISNSLQMNKTRLKKMQDELNKNTDPAIIEKLKKPGYLISGNRGTYQTMMLLILLALPAFAGWALHIFLYYPLKFFVEIKTERSVYFDSLLFTCLFLSYPFYWIAWNLAAYFFIKNAGIQMILLCMPLLAWTTIQWKENLQRIRNYFILSKPERDQLANYFD